MVGRATWNKLREVYTDIANDLLAESLRPGEFPGVLRRGASGRAVRELQYYLYLMHSYNASLPAVNIDGNFGAATEAAVRAFQRQAGLTADGVVGRATWENLYAQANILRQAGPVVTVNRMAYPGAPLEVGSEGARRALLHGAAHPHRLLLQRRFQPRHQLGLHRPDCRGHPQPAASAGVCPRPARWTPTPGRPPRGWAWPC